MDKIKFEELISNLDSQIQQFLENLSLEEKEAAEDIFSKFQAEIKAHKNELQKLKGVMETIKRQNNLAIVSRARNT
jgi:molecular chaperone DnaK (HSP70)